MKTKNQKGGAIFTLLAGLIASAITAGAPQAGGGKVQKRKKEPKIPRRHRYKKWVQPRSTFIYQHHTVPSRLITSARSWMGCPSQNSHQSAPIEGHVVGGLLGGAPQTGQGLIDFMRDPRKGPGEDTWISSLMLEKALPRH
jgi:hypothetical protein